MTLQSGGKIAAVGQISGNFILIRHAPEILTRLARDESALKPALTGIRVERNPRQAATTR